MKTTNETRLNISGVYLYDEVTNPTTKAVSLEPKIVETPDPSNPGQTISEYATTERKKLTENGKVYKDIVELHTKQGWPEPIIDKHQTFSVTSVDNLDEVIPYFVSLGLDPAVAAKSAADIFQRGWAIAQQQEIYAFMDDNDQPEVEGVYSVAASAAQPGERKQKDPMAVISKTLKAAGFTITAAELTALLASTQTRTLQNAELTSK